MKKIGIILYWAVFISAVLAGCSSVHEYPEEELMTNVELSFIFKDSTEALGGDHKVVPYGQTRNGNTVVRYTIEIRDEQNNVVKEKILTDKFESNDVTLTVALPASKDTYHVAAWVDHVVAGSSGDLFYDTAELDFVGVIPDYYTISTDAKDAFFGELTFYVDPRAQDKDGVIRKVIELYRPLAKFVLIADDLQEYLMSASSKPHSIKISYVQNLPYYCNPLKAIKEYIELSALAEIVGCTDTECILGYDWIFALNREIIVNAVVEVFDENGMRITKSKSIEIPLKRNKITTVKGRFLTLKNSGGGIGIEDEFEDEIIVEL